MKAKQLVLSLIAGIVGGTGAFIGTQLLTEKPGQNDQGETKHELVDAYYTKHHATTNKTGIINSIANTDFTSAAEYSLASVVHITTQYNQPNYTVYDFIFGTNPSSYRPVTSTGSGVIISSDGYIVTNNHVIDKSENIQVVLNDKRSYPATLVGTDKATDIALLKIEEKNLPFIQYGDSDDIKIGEWVLAVGNPFNLTSTVTAGIVSAKARNINILSGQYGIESFIQTDAAVNPGNSGGALVNTNGELIGINTAIASRTGSYVGYSFAIPVNIVRKIVADIMEFGEVQRAYLGISMADIDAELAENENIDEIKGVYIAKIFDGSAADKAGLKNGDIILSIEENKVNSSSELMEQLSKYRPGDKLNLRVKRGKREKTYDIKLQNKYGNTEVVQAESIESLDASFESLSADEKRLYRLRNGVRVKKIQEGVFLKNNIREGFIITSVNRKPVNSGKDIEQIIKQSENHAVFIEGIYPNGNIAHYSFELD